MSIPDLETLLDFAVDSAYAAGRITLKYFQSGVRTETKADNTPVTIADREAEALLRERIGRFFPSHSILGEEGGEKNGDPDMRWILDPIDGTKSFIAGVPLYGVLVAAEVRGTPSVGVIYHPALDEMVCAADGLGCTWNGRPCRVSNIADPSQAALMTSSIVAAQARSDAFDRLASVTRLQRTWGDAYGYTLIATGRAEIMLDPAMAPWDCGPLPTILQEAGGHYSCWNGARTISGGDAVATNAALAEQVLAVLRTENRRAGDSQ